MTFSRSILIAAMAVASLATSAFGGMVTFSTLGSFNGAGNSVSFGSGVNTLTISFNGLSPNTILAPSYTSLGTIHTEATGTGAAIAANTLLTINILQTVPSSGTGSLGGSLTGVLGSNSSTGQITFTTLSTSIGNVKYSIANSPLALVPPSTNNGNTTVQASVSDVPEPLTFTLIGAGLLGLGALRRFRKV